MIESMSGSTQVFILCLLGVAFLIAATVYVFLSTKVDALSDEHDRLDALRDLPRGEH